MRRLLLALMSVVLLGIPPADATPAKGCTGTVRFEYTNSVAQAAFDLLRDTCSPELVAGVDAIEVALTLTRERNSLQAEATSSADRTCTLSAECSFHLSMSHPVAEFARYWATGTYTSGGSDPAVWGRVALGFECTSAIATTYCRPLPSPL